MVCVSMQTTNTGQGGAYVLKGYGAIDPAWLRDCLRLFKNHQVNIRRLVLMQDALSDCLPDCLSMLEIQFALPATEASQRPSLAQAQAAALPITSTIPPVTTLDRKQVQALPASISIESTPNNTPYDGFLRELEAHVAQQMWKESTLTSNSCQS